MRGSVGTSMTIEKASKRSQQKRKAKNNMFWCTSCKKYINKGEWMKMNGRGMYRHAFPCK